MILKIKVENQNNLNNQGSNWYNQYILLKIIWISLDWNRIFNLDNGKLSRTYSKYHIYSG